ncbi:hypothetical protein ACT048_04900 [Ectopseudomonas khazarica]|uniref:hypothetical protein n=1 Tax=Ectopseudomonas khazarica TaxID=2502979 RepID=UPI004034D2A3
MKAPWSWLWLAGFAVTSVMLHLAINQRDDARQALEESGSRAASLVLVVILAPQNADGENVARDQVRRGLSL